jgi:hypothetical protein
MALDLNMGYYTIRLDPDASRICTVIFPWGKYAYERLPMGIAGSLGIFQSKMLELMEDLEYVWAYLDDLLCISRSSREDHLKKLEEVLRHLHDAGLKVNSEKSTFCALEIEYLGYALTRDGMKPQSNEVQAILAIQPPTNVKELRHFLGMVQYYRDLWARWRKCSPSHLIGWRMRSDQSHKSQRDQEDALALGWGPSKSFWSRKGCHCKRSSLGLPRLFHSLRDLHQRFKQTVRSSNYSGEQANCIL